MLGSREGQSYKAKAQNMDEHGDCVGHSDKRSKLLSNFTGFVASKASPSETSASREHPVIRPHIASSGRLCDRHDPLPPGFAKVLAGKPISWACSGWKTVCQAVPKRGFPCVQDESSADLKCCHQRNLEAMAAPERRILLCMLKQPLFKGRVFPHSDGNSLHCNCVHSVGPHLGSGSSDNLSASSVGIFLQKHAKGCANLARALVEGKSTRTRLHTLGFARLQGEPGMMCTDANYPDMEFVEGLDSHANKESPESPLALLQRISLRAFTEKILLAAPQQQLEFPDKEMLDSVQDFFLYTEVEGRQVFEELDRDADGKLTMDDIKVAMRKMKLPANYSKDFLQKRHRLWPLAVFKWPEFSSLIQEKEPVIIQLFNSLGVSKSGTVNRIHIKEFLNKAGVSATEANITAMMKLLAPDRGDRIKYGEFRRFMLLLPTEQLTTNPWSVWLEAATRGGVQHSSQKENL